MAVNKNSHIKHIFFITSRKTNKIHKDIIRAIQKIPTDDKNIAESIVADVESYEDCIKRTIETTRLFGIPKLKKEFEELSDTCRNIRELEANRIAVMPELKEQFGKRENAFRHALKKALKEEENFDYEHMSEEERLSVILKDPKWKWIEKLYPSIRTIQKKIFVMTVDKFFTPYDTIIGKIVDFTDPKYLHEETAIFIDESDSAYSDILTRIIIKSECKSSFDRFEAFQFINRTLASSDHIPTRINEDIIGKWKKETEDIKKKYNLFYGLKIPDSILKGNDVFLFHPGRYNLSSGKKYLYHMAERDGVIQNEVISKQKATSTDEFFSLNEASLAVRRFINQFENDILNIAQKNNRENLNDYEDMRNNIFSVLSEFFEDEGSAIKQSMVSEIMNFHKWKNSRKDNYVKMRDSFYENGFSYVHSQDSSLYSGHSKFYSYSVDTTPEALIRNLAENAKVIMMSATALVKSVLCNFNLEYLSEKVDSYILKKEIPKKTYETIVISVDARQYKDSLWGDIFKNIKDLNGILRELNEKCNTYSNPEFLKSRYYRIAGAYQLFVQNKNIDSMITFLTKIPKEGDVSLDANFLKKVFRKIIENNDMKSKNPECEFITLSGSGDLYGDTLQDLKKRWTSREKLMAITTYSSAGQGQNLQYGWPDGIETEIETIGDMKYAGDEKLKDIDAVYVDLPTNIMCNIQPNQEGMAKEEAILTRLYQIMDLYSNAELTKEEADGMIAEVFTGRRNCPNPLETESYGNAILSILDQACGRIDRTPYKKKYTYVFFDKSIIDICNPGNMRKIAMNSVTKELFDQIALLQQTEVNKLCSGTEQEERMLINRCIDNSNWLGREINKLAGEVNGASPIEMEKRDNLISSYETIGEFTLTHGIRMTSDEFIFEMEKLKSTDKIAYVMLSDGYVDLEKEDRRLFYRPTEMKEYRTDIDFSKKNGQWIEINSCSARLSYLMAQNIIKEAFVASGYKTEEGSGTVVMLPSLFNNIYKGRIAEKAIEMIFSKVTGKKLERLPNENYELFDYKVSDTDTYIDVKNWSGSGNVNHEEITKQALRKLETLRGKRVLFINLLYQEGSNISGMIDDRIKEIPGILRQDGSFVNESIEAIKRTVLL